MKAILGKTLTIYFICMNYNHVSADTHVDIDTRHQENAVSQQRLERLDESLLRQEQSFEDLVTGAEKKILWANGKQRSRLGIIYLHGFSASRQEISPVVETVSASLNANAFFTRLRGHGRSEIAMHDASVANWKEDVRQSYEIGTLLADEIVVISTSTGGTLATWLVAQPWADRVVANIMLSPNFGIKDSSGEIVRWRWGLALAKLLNGGEYRSFKPHNEIHKKYWTERYPIDALVPMIDLVDEVEDMDKSVITVPQLIIYAEDDDVIDVESIKRTAAEMTAAVHLAKFAESTDPSQHVLAGDACSPESTDAVIQLIEEFISEKFPSGASD